MFMCQVHDRHDIFFITQQIWLDLEWIWYKVIVWTLKCDQLNPNRSKVASLLQSETLPETIESGLLCITDLFQN